MHFLISNLSSTLIQVLNFLGCKRLILNTDLQGFTNYLKLFKFWIENSNRPQQNMLDQVWVQQKLLDLLILTYFNYPVNEIKLHNPIWQNKTNLLTIAPAKFGSIKL